METKINVGVVGYGYWGPNLCRNFFGCKRTRLTTVCEVNPSRQAAVQRTFPGVKVTADYGEMLKSAEVDAVAVATPIRMHHALAKAALEAGKHVIIEKPLTATVREAEELIELAEKKKRVLMVDHTFLYTGAVRKIKELADSGHLGRILYYDSVRVNLGLFQSDVNVVWDLGPHDLSIMDYILGREAQWVQATGVAHLKNNLENVAYLTLTFDDTLIGHFHLNWLSPVKIRMTLIGGDKQMIVYNDVDPNEKIKVYDKGLEEIGDPEQRRQKLVEYRVGDMWCPNIDQSEALERVCTEFATSIDEQRKPLTDGAAGLRVVRILEAAQASIKSQGRPVKL